MQLNFPMGLCRGLRPLNLCLIALFSTACSVGSRPYDVGSSVGSDGLASRTTALPAHRGDAAADESADSADSAIQVTLAKRELDADQWGPTDEPVAFGLSYNREIIDGLAWDIGLQFGRDADTVPGTSTGLDLDMLELDLGLTKSFFQDDNLQPYFGVGLALIQTDLGIDDNSIQDFNDTSAGFYLRGGVFVPVSEKVRFGVDFKFVRGTDYKFGSGAATVSGDVDYDQVGLIWEFRF